MPDRIIRERSRRSKSLDALSDRAERLFWRLTTVADDYGCFDADLRMVLATCFPLKVGTWAPADMAAPLAELAASGPNGEDPIVTLYSAGGHAYGQLCSFLSHQRKRESKPKFPFPGDPGVVRKISGDSSASRQVAAGCGDRRQIAGGSRESGVGSRESRDESRG